MSIKSTLICIKQKRSRKRRSRSKHPPFHWMLLATALMVACFAFPIAIAQQEQQDSGESAPVIGIDLGTTFSCVAVYRDGNVEIIPNDQGNRITPSYVAFTDTSERLIGDAAKNVATLDPANTVFDAKRLIGRDYSDSSVQADKKLLPFKIVPNQEGKPRIAIENQAEEGEKERLFAPEEISAMVLANLKATAEAYLGHPVTRAVVTVPAYFNQAQRKATQDAGRIAGLQVDRVINEPTASAIAYGLDNSSSMDDKNVLVYDLGGGTFDVTLLNMDDGAFEVLASHGDTHLGGEDFDQRLMQYVTKKVQKQAGVDLASDPTHRALPKLRKEVERVKRALSSQPQARIEIENIVPGYDLQETITRARFDELNHDLFQKTLKPVQEVLKRGKVDKSDVDHIVLVGGSTRIPKIQQLLSDFFDGQELSKGINPDEAVAYGAAVQGAILSGQSLKGSKAEGVILLDKTSLSKGIETVGGVFTTIIPRDTTIPTRKSQVFSTHQDNQSKVQIDVYEGERPMTKDNHALGQFGLTGIPAAPRGVPQIEVTFAVDANGILSVSAEDKGTGTSKSITISADDGQQLSEADIQRMIQEAEIYAEEDRRLRETMDSRNGLESYLYQVKSTLTDDSNTGSASLDPDDLKQVLDEIDDAMDWMEDHLEASKEDCDSRKEDLEQLVTPIIKELYSQNGGDPGGGDDGDFDDVDL